MNFTSKSRYALKIMMDLAHYRDLPLVRRADIAKRQGISSDYLDQLMIRLRANNLVESVRGRSGGYRLAHAPDAITLWDIFHAVEDSIYPVECLGEGHSCDFEKSCVSYSAWGEIFSALQAPLKTMKLSTIVAKWADEHRMCPVGGIRECRPGRSSHLEELSQHGAR